MEGYMKNGMGHLVPVEQVRTIDKLRDEIVRRMIGGAKMLAKHRAQYQEECFGMVTDFVELAAAEHGVTLGGEKGNIQLTSYDGTMRVIRANDYQITFTEGMTAARKIILDCVEKWTEGANKNLAALVQKAFEVDKDGHLSASKILGLYQYDIVDDEWSRAINIIRESVQVVSTKTYIRFYERGADSEYKQIALG